MAAALRREERGMKKILLVDDSSTILMMEKFILRDDPYLVLTASSGEEGVRKAISERPHLILLDVVMPRMSGVEACRLMRERDELAHAAIVLVAARDEAVNVETFRRAGCTGYVTKPINAVELRAKVRALLGTCTANVTAEPGGVMPEFDP